MDLTCNSGLVQDGPHHELCRALLHAKDLKASRLLLSILDTVPTQPLPSLLLLWFEDEAIL